MNLKIKPYLVSLIKENIVYLALGAVLIVVEVAFLSLNLQKISDNNGKIDQLSRDTKTLATKVNSLNLIQLSSDDLNSYVTLLDKLIPSTEDYFSIIYALDLLSKKTGFTITSYALNLSGSNQNQLRLTVTGIGNHDAFLKFLKDYNFGGGRLITSDKIELSQQQSGQIQISITFYNKAITVDPNKPFTLSPSLTSDLTDLKNKASSTMDEATDEGQANLDYPRKTNPF